MSSKSNLGYPNKKIFVTGACGFIGKAFVKYCNRLGFQTVSLCRSASDYKHILNTTIRGDLTCFDSFELKSCDTLVHFAAKGVLGGMHSFSDIYKTNVYDTISLIKLCAHVGIRRIAICGSCFEFGDSAQFHKELPADAELLPKEVYGCSKALMSTCFRELVRQHSLIGLIFRPFHVYGEGEHNSRFWPSLVSSGLNGSNFELSPGKQVRDFVEVRCAVQSILEAVYSLPAYSSITYQNIGSGKSMTLLEFAKQIWSDLEATGILLPGKLDYRHTEIMRLVPSLEPAVYKVF